jgi:hypothetical protein
MKDIRSYVNGNTCIELGSHEAKQLLGPGVYIYVAHDGSSLYVGSTKMLLWRALRKDHETAHAREQSKSVIFIPCKSIKLARELEQELIFDLAPKHNKRGGMNKLADALGMSGQSSAYRYAQSLKRE